jgi:hypothetical protein
MRINYGEECIQMAAKAKKSGQEQSDLPKMSQPAHRALAAAGIKRLADVTKFTEQEISQLHGVGPMSIKELRSALRARCLKFAPAKK